MKVKSLPVALWLLSLATTPSFAISGTIEAKIPFEFTIGDKILPGADYIFEVASTTGASVLTIRSKETGERVMFDSDQLPEKADPKRVELVFDRIRDKVFLMEVWGVVDSGRGVKHMVDGELLARAPETSRQHIA